jgi:hypothetical protein
MAAPLPAMRRDWKDSEGLPKNKSLRPLLLWGIPLSELVNELLKKDIELIEAGR